MFRYAPQQPGLAGPARPRWTDYGPASATTIAIVTALLASGCSIKGMAMGSLADALSDTGGSSVYMTDDDPALVGDALPFSLKLMEMVLQEEPKHEGLLVAAATGFTSYAEMWVLRPAQSLEDSDPVAARSARLRAKALFLRARGYAGRALEVRHPGIVVKLLRSPDEAVPELEAVDLPAMYWFAAAHGRAISADLGDASLMVEGSTVKELLDRALELDEAWNRGALHELYMALPAQLGGGPEVAEQHYARAMELNGGTSIGPLVSLAETVYLPRQDRNGFTRVLNEALAFDTDRYPETRLTNTLAQEHATWLLSRIDELFWMDGGRPTRRPGAKTRRIQWLSQF